MKQLILFTLAAVVLGCNPGNKQNDESKNNATIPPPPATPPPGVEMIPAGMIDIESLGEIYLGQHYNNTLNILGNPDSKSKPVEWEADGLMHEDWTWKNKGLVLNMASEINKPDSLTVFSITARNPCTFKTKAGIGIGSSYVEAHAAY
jgi:hypothetical protein